MTIRFSYNNDNGTNGNVVTTGLSGYTTMTGDDPVYSNAWSADGLLSALYTLAGSNSIHRFDLVTPATNTYWRRYFKITSMPSVNATICVVADTAGVHLGDVRLLTTGAIQLRNAGSAEIDVSTHTFAAGDVFRLEYHPIVGGTSAVRLFYGANLHGTTADEIIQGTNGTAGTGLIVRVTEGCTTNSTWTFAADATVIDDAAYPGPIAGAPEVKPVTGTITLNNTVQGAASVIQAVATTPPSLRMQVFKGAVLSTNGTGLLTSAARWTWSTAGYANPGGNITPVGGGMQFNWAASPATVGNGIQLAQFSLDTTQFVPGHRIKAKVTLQVPTTSPDVAIASPATGETSPWVTAKGVDVEVPFFFTWSEGRSPLLGIQSVASPGGGSVVIKRIEVVDISSPAGTWQPVGVEDPQEPTDTTAPTTPGQPVAVVTDDQVALTWAASTDNVAVLHYEVHRSITTGFTPAPGTLKTLTPLPQWNDNAVPNGTYYYKVIAVDAAGNKSTASTQRSATVTGPPPPSSPILSGISTQLTFGNRTDWDGYRVYNSGRMLTMANSTGDAAALDKPKFLAYNKQGSPFSGSYATIRASCITDLNNFYYTSQTGQTRSSRWGIKLYWSNGNEMMNKGMLGDGAQLYTQTPANVALYVESQRALYDACHYIDPTTGQRRFPDAYAGSNPTQDAENQGGVELYLHPSARYHDFVMWSMYPPGRQGSTVKLTDPEYNWPSFDPADWNDQQLGFMLRCFRRTSLARAQARIDTGNPNFDITINCGETGIASDPDDRTTRPYYAVFGLFGAAAALGQQYGLTVDFMCYWDNQLAGANPHVKILDEPPNSDHFVASGNTIATDPSTPTVWKNWASYHPDHGGAVPGAWAGNPKAGWKDTGTPIAP